MNAASPPQPRDDFARLMQSVRRLPAQSAPLAELLGVDEAALEAAHGRARALLEAGHHTAARDALKALVAMAPERGRTVRLLGFAYQRCHQIDAAYGAFERATQLDPSDAIAALMLGECALFVLGPKTGVAQLEQALRWATDIPQVHPYVLRARQLLAMLGAPPAPTI